MATQDDNLTFREKALLTLVLEQNGRMLTADIYRVAKMAKATALKNLAVLEAKGKIKSEYIGPVKLWWIIEHCPECNAAMIPEFTHICPICQAEKKSEQQDEKNKK